MLLGRKPEPEAVQFKKCVRETGKECSPEWQIGHGAVTVSTAHKPEEEVMASEGKEKLITVLTRCDAIARSHLFVQIGHPEDQVTLLKATLLRAAAEGLDWREIYRLIYERWHTDRPHFPDL